MVMMMDIFRQALDNDVKAVIDGMTHPEMADEKGKSLLHHAVIGSATDVIDALLASDVNVNLADEHGETPIFDCARKGKVQIAKKLLARYAKVNLENRMGETPLHLAAAKGDLDMLRLLIESGGMTNKKTRDDRLPVHYAILNGRTDAVAYLLKEGGQSWYQKDFYGNSLLHYATKTASVEMIDMLLNQNLDPNRLNDQFETPMFNAVRYGTVETLRILLANDAYIDIRNRRFETPLDLALMEEKKDILEHLKSYMATPKYERLAEKQALAIAVLNRDHNRLRALLEKSFPLRPDKRQKTALDYAKEYNLGLCVNMLRTIEEPKA
jgi:ankyrin repeat protein